MVDKAPGDHSQPPASPTNHPSVLDTLQSSFGESVRLIHRLDRDASGLLVFARTPKAAGILGSALKKREFERVYRVRVGVMLPIGTKGTIDLPLKWAGGRAWVDEAGVIAITHWVVVSHADGASELEVRLETGRMHQIRVHMAARLAPVLGDRKYRGTRADKLYLRAVHLGFTHPHTQEWRSFAVSGF